MTRPVFLRQVVKALRALPRLETPSTPWRLPTALRRPLHTTTLSCQAEKNPSSAGQSVNLAASEGSLARTDSRVRVEYPSENDLPANVTGQGRDGRQFKRTLASFSLEGRVAIVTGGARGLGLVMSQALVISGADLAIVDLNSRFGDLSLR